jgi:hypothetical protein
VVWISSFVYAGSPGLHTDKWDEIPAMLHFTLPEKVPWVLFFLGVVAVCLISDPEPKLNSPGKCQDLQATKTFLQCQDLQATKTFLQCQDLQATKTFLQCQDPQAPKTLLQCQDPLDWLSIQNRYAQTWLIGPLGDWVEIYHCSNSAAFLLVLLLLTPHFRQTLCTLRNLPSQVRDTVKANDSLDTDRRILEFLISLLKNCKECVDISCHETTMLVPYFQEMTHENTKLVSYFQEVTHLLPSKHEKLIFGYYFQDLWQLFYPKLSEPSILVHQNKQALLNFLYSATVDYPENIKLLLTNPHVVKNIAFSYILAYHEDFDIVKFLNRMKPSALLPSALLS